MSGRTPDFVVIGAMKCATSTLHVQLGRQEGIFTTEPKEPNFFSDDEVFARGLGWYGSLFEGAAPGDLRGESSTHYTKLPTYPRTVQRAREVLRDGTRFVYVMRHPVDRLISHYIHEWTQRLIDEPIDEAVRSHSELVDYGRYAMQLRPWLEAFGSDRVLPVFSARLKHAPREELTRVCRFLGFAGEPVWHDGHGANNVSELRMRKSVVRDAVIGFPPLRWLRRTFVPRSARERVKRIWRISDRPALSEECRAELEEVFDADLADLGEWLGVELTCETFEEVARRTEPRWVGTPSRASG